MTKKIHDLQTALEALHIKQTVSFDDCQKIMIEVHEKTGFTPPNFELSGNKWCVLVNLAVARFGAVMTDENIRSVRTTEGPHSIKDKS